MHGFVDNATLSAASSDIARALLKLLAEGVQECI
jgi:hypothetical protein